MPSCRSAETAQMHRRKRQRTLATPSSNVSTGRPSSEEQVRLEQAKEHKRSTRLRAAWLFWARQEPRAKKDKPLVHAIDADVRELLTESEDVKDFSAPALTLQSDGG